MQGRLGEGGLVRGRVGGLAREQWRTLQTNKKKAQSRYLKVIREVRERPVVDT